MFGSCFDEGGSADARCIECGHFVFISFVRSKTLANQTDIFILRHSFQKTNSLGPGELLARYGTDEQKEYFLPRLANGTLIPCFGLTGPHSGSDATSLIGSDCVVRKHPETGELGVVSSFKKRYITLAPVAGVVGLGLNLSDPEGLLGGCGEEGFTAAMAASANSAMAPANYSATAPG